MGIVRPLVVCIAIHFIVLMRSSKILMHIFYTDYCARLTWVTHGSDGIFGFVVYTIFMVLCFRRYNHFSRLYLHNVYYIVYNFKCKCRHGNNTVLKSILETSQHTMLYMYCCESDVSQHTHTKSLMQYFKSVIWAGGVWKQIIVINSLFVNSDTCLDKACCEPIWWACTRFFMYVPLISISRD